jgi:hypothetical protein
MRPGKTSRGRRLSRVPINCEPITASKLFDMLEQVLRKPPAASPVLTQALSILAGKMMARRELFLANEVGLLRNELARSTRETAEELHRQLVALAQVDRQFLDRAERAAFIELKPLPETGPPPLPSVPQISAKALRARIDRLNALADQARNLETDEALAENRNPIDGWQDAIAVLRDDVTDVLKVALGREVGVTNPQGPSSKFFALLLPLVCGERPAEATVRDWLDLKRQARRRKPEKKCLGMRCS